MHGAPFPIAEGCTAAYEVCLSKYARVDRGVEGQEPRMGSQNMATQLRRLYDGELSFDKFYASTKKEWRLLSAYLWRRWTLPAGVTRDDVEQEMLLGVWLKLPKWDATKAELESFIVWNACDRAKKWIHKQRGANRHRHADASPGRYDKAFSSLAGTRETPEAFDRRLDAMMKTQEPDQEERVDFARLICMIPERCDSERGRQAVRYFIEASGDAKAAGEMWFADCEERFRFRLGGEQEAVGIVNHELRLLQESFAA